MQMLNQNKNNNKKIKKSHLLLIGSLLIFIGLFVLSFDTIKSLKDEILSEMKISMMDNESNTEVNTTKDVIDNVPIAEDITNSSTTNNVEQQVNYDKYLGVLEIPRISLKRGFYNTDSKYNNIQYNVTLVNGSQLPDVTNGNLILMAHSGDAYISYFAFLYKLKIGDYAYITYRGTKYKYQLVSVYDVDKVGKVTIMRNYDKTTLTLITCTKDDSNHQTIYILELV